MRMRLLLDWLNNGASPYGIASYMTMNKRIDILKANGIDAMIEVFQGLPHGFGLGTGTVAEGWLNNAVDFWERSMPAWS